jgi:predicted ATPase
MNWGPEDDARSRLEKLEAALRTQSLPLEDVVPLYAALMSLPLPENRYPALAMTPKQQRDATLDALVGWLLDLAESKPVLQLCEDLHWADPTTLELLGLYIEQSPTASVLNVLTYRPEFVPPWTMRSHMTPITLNRLERPDVEAFVNHLTGGKSLPSEVLEHIVSKADGVPLYVEELTKTILESEVLHEEADRYLLDGTLAALQIPSTLQDALMARLDRAPELREVAQMGAVLGREFAYDMLNAVIALNETVLQSGLVQLVESELLYQRGRGQRSRYIFKHALIQDAAYQSLLKRTRRQYHQQVAELLEVQFPEIVETQPELVAHHFSEADLAEQAIGYWQRAGNRASERSAHQEAMSHLTRGLTLLQTMPETQARHQQELRLQTALGAAALIARGHAAPEVEAAFNRARHLCQLLGDTEDVFPVLFGLWRFYVARPDFSLCQELSEELHVLTKGSDETPLQVVAHYAAGATSMWVGELVPARENLREGVASYTPEQRSFPIYQVGQDPGVACRAYTGKTLWLLGYPDQALASMNDALSLATELAHPFSQAFALNIAAIGLQLRREGKAVYEHADAGVTLSTEQGFPHWVAFSTILRGWALADLGQQEEGLTQMRQGLSDWRATGAELFVPYYLSLIAEVYGDLAQVEAGLDALKEGLEVMERTGEDWWKAEMYRCTGSMLLLHTTPDVTQAEICFEQALATAHQQQGRSFELRAAIDLAQLWQRQGKHDKACRLLTPVYAWFSEGFDTADLKDARSLLDELEAPRSDTAVN